MRAPLLALATTLLVAFPSIQAGPGASDADPASDPTAPLADLFARASQASDGLVDRLVAPSNATLAASGDGALAFLAALGDVNQDGHDDFVHIDLVFTVKGDEVESLQETASLRSGADPTQVLWRFAAAKDALLGVVPDVDGDGLRDLVEIPSAELRFDTQSQSVVVAGLFTVTLDGVATITFRSGKDVGVLQERSVVIHEQFVEAYAFPLVAFALAVIDLFNIGDLYLVQPGLVAQIEGASTGAFVVASAVVAGVFADAGLRDMSGRFFDAHGQDLGAFALAHPLGSPRGLAVGDLDGDGLADAAGVEVISVAPLYLSETGDLSLLRLATVHAFSSKGGAELWTADLDPIVGQVGGPYGTGDLTADGAAEMAILTMHLAGLGVTYTTRVLSGSDGGVLAAADVLAVPIPFADVDGNGDHEAMWAMLTEDAVRLGPAGADLAPVWQTDFGDDDAMANLAYTYGFQPRFSDLTGDGIPDLLMLRDVDGSYSVDYDWDGEALDRSFDIEPYSFRIELLSGTTGAAVWQHEAKDILQFRTVGDFDGDGGQDVALVFVQGPAAGIGHGDFREATLTLEVRSGADGSLLASRVLREPSADPVHGDGPTFVDAESLGDLDGDGDEELAILVEEIAQDPPENGPEVPRQTWYLLDTGGRLLGTVANVDDDPAAAAAGEGAPGDFAPAVEPKGKGKGAPGLGLVFVLAAVLVALRRRR